MQNVLHFLEVLDRRLLLAAHGAHHPVADAVMAALSSRESWGLLLPVLLGLAWRYSWRRVGPGAGVALAAVLLANTLASDVIKPWVARPRPCHDPALASLLHVPAALCSESFSFLSSHAADVGAVAVVGWLVLPAHLRGLRVGLLLWSGAVAYSRLYLGEHYPTDVVAGLGLGSACALVLFRLLQRCWPAGVAYLAEKAQEAPPTEA